MADVKPPRQFVLDARLFPEGAWVRPLVESLNQFSQETTAALNAAGTTYKMLTVSTGATVAASFPIDLAVGFAPMEVRVAQVQEGTVTPGNAVTVQWQPLPAMGRVRITNISGLSANTTYRILLAME